MKKFLFSALIVVSFTATAQQNSPFDIDRHLQQKLEELKRTGNSKPGARFIPNTFFSLNNYYSGSNNNYTLPNGDKIITPPFCSMPCIVPDMKQFQIMPNAANISALPDKGNPGNIPNAANSRLSPYTVLRPGY